MTRPERAMGNCGARMSDTTAAGGDAASKGNRSAAPATHKTAMPGKSSMATPVIAGFAASRISLNIGDVPLGVVHITLIATGLALVGQRGAATRGLLCLAGGGLLTWRAYVRAR